MALHRAGELLQGVHMIVMGGHSLRGQVRRRQRIKAAHACMVIPSIAVCLLHEHHLILNLLLLLIVV